MTFADRTRPSQPRRSGLASPPRASPFSRRSGSQSPDLDDVKDFNALSGIEKARRLDAGDPLARFVLGGTWTDRARCRADVVGYVEHYVTTICPACRNQTARYDPGEKRWKCPCGWADRAPRW